MLVRDPQPHELTTFKWCGGCEATKPWIDFSPERRDQHGTVTLVKSRCRSCQASRARRARHAEREGRERRNGRERIPQPSEWVRTKRCPQCTQTKPWALYSPAFYWPDGSIRRVKSWCRDCCAKDNRKRTPALTKRRKRYVATWQRRRRAQKRRDQSAKGIYIDAGPFKEWLRAQRLEPGDLAELSEAAGLHRDTLDNVLGRKRLVGLNTVDAAMTARGAHARELYPDEYERAAK